MRDSLFYTLLAVPLAALLVWFYTLTRWGDFRTYYAVVFIDAIILAGPTIARRRRDQTILHYSSPLGRGNSLQERTDTLAQKMGIGPVIVHLADSQRLRRINALQVGVRKPAIVISGILLRELLPEEQDAILAHELAHAKRRHVLKRTLVSYGYFLAGLDLALFAGYWSLPLEWSTALIQAGVVLFLAGVLLTGPYMGAQFEAEADQVAVQTIGSADPLASALTKLVQLYPIQGLQTGFLRLTSSSFKRRLERLKAPGKTRSQTMD